MQMSDSTEVNQRRPSQPPPPPPKQPPIIAPIEEERSAGESGLAMKDMSPVTTPTDEDEVVKSSNPFEEEETITATTTPATPPIAERDLGPTEQANSAIAGPSSNPFGENAEEDDGVEGFVEEEEDRNSLEDSDGDEEDDDRESVLTLQTMGSAVDQEAKTNATARVASLRNIDSQRAKNALNEYESDHEFDGEDRDDMFTRRQSIAREPSFISPSSATFATDGSMISAKLPSTPTGGSSAKESPFSMNSYGIRVPKIKRGVVELQSQRMFRRWKKRYFHLERGSVIYFEPLHWYQEGEFDLAGLDIATELKPNDDLALTIRLQSPRYPDICFKCHSAESKLRWMKAFRIHIDYANQMKRVIRSRGRNGSLLVVDSAVTFERGDELIASELKESYQQQPQQAMSRKRGSTVTVAIVPAATITTDYTVATNDIAPSAVSPEQLQKAVNKFIEVMPIIKPVVDKEGVPLVHTGWLEKKGQWFPTIRRRFFLLFDGMLSYYRCEWDIHPYVQQVRQEQATGKASAQKKIRPPRALGKFAITNYQFRTDFEHGRVEITMYPSLASPSRRVLVVYCNDFMERDSWLRHFNAHAEYIKKGETL